MIYHLSKDYNALFDLLLAGHEPVCFVDNRHDESPDVARDVCRVRRLESHGIIAVSRGVIYFSVDKWVIEESALSEREIFCGMCENSNVEWVKPGPDNDVFTIVDRIHGVIDIIKPWPVIINGINFQDKMRENATLSAELAALKAENAKLRNDLHALLDGIGDR